MARADTNRALRRPATDTRRRDEHVTGIDKRHLAKIALDGAVAAIRGEYPDHCVEVVTDEPLLRQVRVRPMSRSTAAPRYFAIKVSEPL